MDVTFTCLVSQLSVSMIYDLGLHKPRLESLLRPTWKIQLPGVPQPPTSVGQRTMEERRAVLGAFIITSALVIFSDFA